MANYNNPGLNLQQPQYGIMGQMQMQPPYGNNNMLLSNTPYDNYITIEQEQLVADLISTYGDQIVYITNKIFNKLGNI